MGVRGLLGRAGALEAAEVLERRAHRGASEQLQAEAEAASAQAAVQRRAALLLLREAQGGAAAAAEASAAVYVRAIEGLSAASGALAEALRLLEGAAMHGERNGRPASQLTTALSILSCCSCCVP
jgi:hypothetical protein